MIIVDIIGGLGNQMFQYAFAYAVSKTNNATVKLDVSSYQNQTFRKYELGLFNINLELAREKGLHKRKLHKRNSLFQKLRRRILLLGLYYKELLGLYYKELLGLYYKEPHHHFDEKALRVKDNVHFNGYWQSEKYFKAYRSELLKQFTLKKEIQPATQKYKRNIIETESISLHIRRGDYLTNRKPNREFGVCNLDYYKNAVLSIKQQANNPVFFVFSDDMIWAKDNLDFIDDITFVELKETASAHEEMHLMSLCKHHIIANSTFSWWGAWLNQNPDKMVIAPQKWFNNYPSKDTRDLIPGDWIRL